MKNAEPLTAEEIRVIEENKGVISVRRIAEMLNLSPYRIWNYFALKKRKEEGVIESGFFNVNEKENWLIG